MLFLYIAMSKKCLFIKISHVTLHYIKPVYFLVHGYLSVLVGYLSEFKRQTSTTTKSWASIKFIKVWIQVSLIRSYHSERLT